MTAIGLLVAVLIVIVILATIEVLSPLPAPYQMIFRLVGVVILLVLLLQFFGFLPGRLVNP